MIIIRLVNQIIIGYIVLLTFNLTDGYVTCDITMVLSQTLLL